MGNAKSILALSLLATFLGGCQRGSFDECILDRMQGMDQDSGAGAVYISCQQDFGDRSSSPPTLYSSWEKCVATKGKGTLSAVGFKLIVVSCMNLSGQGPVTFTTDGGQGSNNSQQ